MNLYEYYLEIIHRDSRVYDIYIYLDITNISCLYTIIKIYLLDIQITRKLNFWVIHNKYID